MTRCVYILSLSHLVADESMLTLQAHCPMSAVNNIRHTKFSQMCRLPAYPFPPTSRVFREGHPVHMHLLNHLVGGVLAIQGPLGSTRMAYPPPFPGLKFHRADVILCWKRVYEVRTHSVSGLSRTEKSVCSYAFQMHRRCHHWPEARWRFCMSIIRDDFTGVIVSRPSSIKRTPPLSSSSSHQLSPSRAVIEAYDPLELLFSAGVPSREGSLSMPLYAPQVTCCIASPRLAM